MNSLNFFVHRDFGTAEFDFDFENVQNSKWQKLKTFSTSQTENTEISE